MSIGLNGSMNKLAVTGIGGTSTTAGSGGSYNAPGTAAPGGYGYYQPPSVSSLMDASRTRANQLSPGGTGSGSTGTVDTAHSVTALPSNYSPYIQGDMWVNPNHNQNNFDAFSGAYKDVTGKLPIPSQFNTAWGGVNGHLMQDRGTGNAGISLKRFMDDYTTENPPGFAELNRSPSDTGVRPGAGGLNVAYDQLPQAQPGAPYGNGVADPRNAALNAYTPTKGK